MKNWTIGNLRRHKVDLGLDDSTVSGLHASLTRTDDGRWKVEDRNSTNGTARFINGRWVRISQAYVLPDDRLRFGSAETTVRQLLASSHGAPQPAPADVVPWRQDLYVALTEIRNLNVAGMKKALLFVPDLVLSPAHEIMRCAYRRQPVNPFTFMIFGGLIYTMIAASGLSISSLMNMDTAKVASTAPLFLKGIPRFIAPLILTLIFNMLLFFLFRWFSPHRRYFDDFMRVTAVLSGTGWMLSAFLFVLLNEHLQAPQDAMALYILAVIILIYQLSFNIIGYKHFWAISYARATICYVLGLLAFLLALTIVLTPLIMLAAMRS